MGVSRQELKTIAVVLASAVIMVLSLMMLSPALPVIMHDMGVNATTVQWLTSGYALVEAVVIPLAAYFMGRFTTRQFYLGALVLFACGCVLSAFAPNFALLMTGRAMQAAATGLVMPTTVALIILIVPREKRGTGMGIVSLVIGFAPTIGPTVGGILVDTTGWRELFLIVAALAVLVFIFATFILVNFEGFKRTKFDPLSVIFSSLGLLSVLYSISTLATSSNIILNIVLILVGAAFIVLFVRRQLKLEEPMLRVTILKTKNFAVNVIVVMLIQAGLMGLGVVIPLFIQTVLGYSPTVSGLTLLPGALLGALSAMVSGRLFDRFGVRPVVLYGSIIMVLGALAFTFLQMDVSVIFVGASYAVMAHGLQFTMTSMNTWGMNSLDNNAIQHATPVSNCLNRVAGSFGTALLVSLYALSGNMVTDGTAAEVSYAGSHVAFIGTATLLTLALILIVVCASDKRRGTKPKAAEPVQTAVDFQAAALSNQGLSGAISALAPTVTVRDVMIDDVYHVHKEASVRDLITLLLDTNTTGITIVDDDERIVGFISDGDVMKYIGENQYALVDASLSLSYIRNDDSLQERVSELLELNVLEIATTRVVTVEPDLSIDQACKILAERRIKKLPVALEGKLIGSLSRGDVIRFTMSNLVGEQA